MKIWDGATFGRLTATWCFQQRLKLPAAFILNIIDVRDDTTDDLYPHEDVGGWLRIFEQAVLEFGLQFAHAIRAR